LFELRRKLCPHFGKAGTGIPIANFCPARNLAGIAEQQNGDVGGGKFGGSVEETWPKIFGRAGKLAQRGQFLQFAREILFHNYSAIILAARPGRILPSAFSKIAFTRTRPLAASTV